MIKAVKSIQGVTNVPLQIDSTIPEVLEAALRVYNGKPMVNSVNGEEESLKNVLPLVKKYGAAVVGLTLDKDGIPPKAEQRVAIAEKIIKRCEKIGIPKEDICDRLPHAYSIRRTTCSKRNAQGCACGKGKVRSKNGTRRIEYIIWSAKP